MFSKILVSHEGLPDPPIIKRFPLDTLKKVLFLDSHKITLPLSQV